jgi:CHAT domain-containing protein/tetratricopeptide (TPR) repeat protein
MNGALPELGNEDLWSTALMLEQAGRFLEAAETLARLPIERPSLSDKDRSEFNLFVVERIATNLARAGRYDEALKMLVGMEGVLRRSGDAFGQFSIGLKLIELALGASHIPSARSFCDDLRDDSGKFGPLDASPPAQRLERLEGLQFRGVAEPQTAVLRGQAFFVHARVWAAVGRYGPAVAALEQAEKTLAVAAQARWATPATAPFVADLRHEARVFLMELETDRGRPKEALRRLDTVFSTLRPTDARAHVLRARAAAMAGRLTDARKSIEDALADPSTSAHVRAHVLWIGTNALILLNRTLDAEKMLRDYVADLGLSVLGDARLDPWRRRFDRLADLIERRRDGDALAWLPPLLPEEDGVSVDLFDTVEPSRSEDRIVVSVDSVERFFQRWSNLANQVLFALRDRDLNAAEEGLALLERLATETDSRRIRGRTRLFVGLCAFARGRTEDACVELAVAVDAAVEDGLIPDEWQARQALASALEVAGRTADSNAESTKTQKLYETWVSELDHDDAVYLGLNKVTARDQYVIRKVRAFAATLPKSTPIGLGSLWERRCRSRAARSMLEGIEGLTGWELERRLGRRAATASRGRDTPVVGDAEPGTIAEVEHVVANELTLAKSEDGRKRGVFAAAWAFWAHPRTAVVQCYSLHDRLLFWVVTSASVTLHEVLTSRGALRAAVHRAIDAIVNERDGRGSAEDAESKLVGLATALGLDRWLATLAPRIDRLIVIPHDALGHAPLAALPFRGGRVCDHFTTTLLPHARSLRLRSGRPLQGVRAEALAVSIYDVPSEPALGNLPAALDEAADVLEALGTPGFPLMDEQVTPEAVEAALARAHWLHVVCHGELPSRDPHNAALILWEGRRLRLRELAAAKSGPRGVVLAACQLGGSRVLPGNAIVCMPAALMRAGAGGVVAPLWSTLDAAAAQFMVATYREARKMRFARALAHTQSVFSAARAPLHVWAPYVAYGEP